MDYNQKLIDKAKRSRCRICMEYISEADAAACEFQACKTSRGGYSFVHTRCWKGEKEVEINGNKRIIT
ncbi:hypothetical protein HNQ56_003753 [Anaerotaenia torta]|uniref:hypothetical protein n=1 Tax=Anaerotaenia torta TaxID=433293 RepID=UPI003D1C951C